MKHLLSLEEVSGKEILSLIDLAIKIKKNPRKFEKRLHNKVLLMLFEKPSLRTRLSFEVAMLQLGVHAIYYDLTTSPLEKGKENIEDTAKVVSRYVDVIMARLFEHSTLEKLAANASVPVINGLTNFSHPCQVLSDLLTIKEKFGKLKGLKLSYFGDANNNVTHSLLFALPKVGMHLTVFCPDKSEFRPRVQVSDIARREARHNATKLIITSDIKHTTNSDIVYTDSWMSYHIPKSQQRKRAAVLKKFQVNSKVMKAAGKAIFMHCLPAQRGMEVTADVIDSKRSVVFDQAENRLHMEKAILIWLLK